MPYRRTANVVRKLAARHAFNRVAPSLDWSGLALADLVIEAVVEKMEVKQDGFARLDNVAEVRSLTQPLGVHLPILAVDPEGRGPINFVLRTLQPALAGFRDEMIDQGKQHYAAEIPADAETNADKKYVTRLDIVLRSDPFEPRSADTLRVLQAWLHDEIVRTPLVTGTVQAAQFPALTGDVTTTAGSFATTLANLPQSVLLTRTGALTFFEPDIKKFPCLRLARAALDVGGTAPVILNAANEVTVAAFLDRRLPFNDIPALIERALDRLEQGPLTSIEQCVSVDAEARRRVQDWIDTRAGGA